MVDHYLYNHLHHNRFTALFLGPPGWAGARTELLDLMVHGKINRDRHMTIRRGTTPSGLNSAHLHHPPIFLQAGCPSCRPTSSVKAPKATSACTTIGNNQNENNPYKILLLNVSIELVASTKRWCNDRDTEWTYTFTRPTNLTTCFCAYFYFKPPSH